jgi:hypothetical protein
MKTLISTIFALYSIVAHADWYYVTAVTSYNTLTAHLADPASEQKDLHIRIANLENIEDIQNDRKKILLAGEEPKELARDILEHQVVWIDQLEVNNGENVANVYPTYDQVLRAYTQRRIGGTYSISPAVMQKIQRVCSRMLSKIATETPNRNPKQAVRSNMPENGNQSYDLGWYENDYTRALFVYDALNWFKHQGQYLPERVQDMYIGWLDDYLNASGVDALSLEIKVQDMQGRSDLYRDFLFDE